MWVKVWCNVLDVITHIAHHRCNAPRSYTELPLPFLNPSISVINKSPSAAASIISKNPQVINVDSPGVEERPEAPKMLVTACKGYIPDGKSPHTTYPFALHNMLILLWDYMIWNGEMVLFLTSCTGIEEGKVQSCQPCQQLHRNKTLEKIVSWIKDGVHENTNFAYLGFSGLQEIFQQKNQQIEFYQFCRLNQAKQLIGKAAALSENKRLLMAIVSGKMQHVDCIISIGLCQKKGVRGLLASVMAAAHGHYRPKSYSEEENMTALLIW